MTAVIRTRLQNETTPPRKYTSLPQTARVIWREEGYHGMYRGLWANLCRTIPASVGTFVTYEFSLKEVHAVVDAFASVDRDR
ncbi:MAG: hypothetical protein BJ554DRAFT_1206 [Olpidium bornovanus]|uniref:Mitochondrial carrier domain-containing protein n=1 Tax=Olpidium bornovanus TaxID=278681 RepID=A0A8H7ZS72_9FUNG|nr:MAG: hypothetical protein BJ554DRAFT_1206 [Olpidium bornovanus]